MRFFIVLVSAMSLFFSTGCNDLLKSEEERKAIARVGETFLYKDDIAPLLTEGISKEDSISLVTNYINNWASKQLLLEKAKINLPEEKLAKFNTLVSDYRTDLYTRAYKEALVQKSSDSVITGVAIAKLLRYPKGELQTQGKIGQVKVH